MPIFIETPVVITRSIPYSPATLSLGDHHITYRFLDPETRATTFVKKHPPLSNLLLHREPGIHGSPPKPTPLEVKGSRGQALATTRQYWPVVSNTPIPLLSQQLTPPPNSTRTKTKTVEPWLIFWAEQKRCALAHLLILYRLHSATKTGTLVTSSLQNYWCCSYKTWWPIRSDARPHASIGSTQHDWNRLF